MKKIILAAILGLVVWSLPSTAQAGPPAFNRGGVFVAPVPVVVVAPVPIVGVAPVATGFNAYATPYGYRGYNTYTASPYGYTYQNWGAPSYGYYNPYTMVSPAARFPQSLYNQMAWKHYVTFGW